MTTITANQHPTDPKVTLDITPTGPIHAVYRSDANGRVAVRGRADQFPIPFTGTELRRNLCSNPSSNRDKLTGWNVLRATLTAEDGNIPNVLRQHFRATVNSLTTGNFAQRVDFTTGNNTVTAGQEYKFSLWMRNSATSIAGAVAYFFDAANSQIGPSLDLGNQVGSTWANLTATGTAPAGATKALLRIGLLNQTGWVLGDFFDFGAVYIGKPGDYFDGDTPSDGTTAYKWDGPLGSEGKVESVQIMPDMVTVEDWEAAAGLVTYTPVIWDGTDWDPTPPTADVEFTLATPWLSVPALQNLSRPVTSVINYDATANTRSTVIDIPGRPDPVVVSRAMGTRRGSFEIFVGAHAEVTALKTICGMGEALMLRQPEHAGLDMYFIPTTVSTRVLRSSGRGSVFSLVIGYVEILSPNIPVQALPGWDFAALAAAYPNFATVGKKYVDFKAVAENRPKEGV